MPVVLPALTCRRVRGLAFLVALVLAVPLPAKAADDRLTVATYNALFLLDVFDDPYTNDEEHAPKKRHQLEDLARAIRAVDADVIALQEIENEGTLRALAVEHLSGMNYRQIAAVPTNSVRGQNLGLLSRHPILSVTSHKHQDFGLEGEDRRWYFARDLMRVRLRVTPKRDLHVFVVHLKSKRNSEGDPQSATRRLAEATAVRRIVEEAMRVDPNGWYLLVGDMNDTPDSAPINVLLGRPGPLRLVDMHAHLPASRRITYLRGKYRSTIDYMLASPSLAAISVPKEASVLREQRLLLGSDHAPVAATFTLGTP